MLAACADAPPTASDPSTPPPGPALVIRTPIGQVAEQTIEGGGWYSLVLRPDGTVAAWGDNGYRSRPFPWEEGYWKPTGTHLPPGLSGVVALSSTGDHALALRADGTVVGWGDNWAGQANAPPLTGVVAIGTGWHHSLAVRNDGTVTAWGSNAWGESSVPEGLSNVVSVAGGRDHSLALRADGTVVTWGRNEYGEAAPPAGLSGIVAIAASWGFSVALRGDGTVVAWGYPEMTRVPAGLSGVVAIAAGDGHALALKSDGTIVGWGSDDEAQLRGAAGLTDIVAIGAGHYHSIALRRDGRVVAWGDNSFGQLSVPAGLTARVPNSAPWANGILAPAGIVSGHRYTFAISAGDPDGDALTYAWDMNGDGTPEQTSNVAGIYHAYPTGGTHTVRVTITDAKGIAVQRSTTVAVEQNVAPVASITPIPAASEWALVYPRAAVTDANSASDPTGVQYARYEWDFGDGTTSTDPTPSKRYNDSGTYRIQLTVTDRGGASSTTETQVQIANVAPRATFVAPAGTTMPVLSPFILHATSVTDPSPYDRTSLEISFDCGYGYYGWARDLKAVVSCVARPGASHHTVGMRVRDKDGAVTEYKRNYTLYTLQ